MMCRSWTQAETDAIERERERKGEYIQEKTYIIYGYIPSFSLVEHFIR